MQSAVAVGTYVVALLMVSTFRYWSFKEIDFARRRPLQTLLVVVLGVMIVATNHEIFPFLLFVGYAVSGRSTGSGRDARRPGARPRWRAPRESH